MAQMARMISELNLMRRTVALVLLASLFSMIGMGPSASAQTVNGRARFAGKCASCHGNSAEGNENIKAPPLSGQNAEYLIRQIENFRSGRRHAINENSPATIMIAIAQTLTDDAEIRAIANYLSKLPVKQSNVLNPSVNEQGRLLFPVCIGCHSSKGEGNSALGAPRIAGMPSWYLAGQLHAFKEGGRGTTADDKYGRQMVSIADSLIEPGDFEAVAAYLSSLSMKK